MDAPIVGIDEELERLLAEHPGLVMEDDKTIHVSTTIKR